MTDRLRELERAATPGPWVPDDTSDGHSDDLGREVSTGWFRRGPGQVDVGDYNTLTYADAAFIAALRNLVPELLDVVDAAFIQDSERWHCLICDGWDGQHNPESRDGVVRTCPVAAFDAKQADRG